MLRVVASLHIRDIHLQFTFHVMSCLENQKTKIMASGAITSWQIDVKTVETLDDFIFGGSKITADGTAAMKLKDAYFLEEKL